MSKITTIEIGNMTREQGEKIKARLDNKTFMNFEIIVAPIGGESCVTAQTNYAGTEKEITEMFIFLMASELVS